MIPGLFLKTLMKRVKAISAISAELQGNVF